MVVIAVFRRVFREGAGQVRRFLFTKLIEQSLEFAAVPRDYVGKGVLFPIELDLLAAVAAAEFEIKRLISLARAHLRETAFGDHRGFKRQLRGEADAHL